MSKSKHLKAADDVLADLSDRKGVGDELDAVDAEVFDEIRHSLAEIIRREYEPTPAEAES